MNYSQTHNPLKLNLDKSPKDLLEDESFYLLNQERNSTGYNLGKTMPMPANFKACDVEQPFGNNFTVGSFKSPITNELYSWVYNAGGHHYIQRINSDGECEIVYDGYCLNFSADPRHEITKFRAYLRVERICSGRHGKYLVWVDGNNDEIFHLDVEASIATFSFTTQFFARCPDDCAAISLCVPKPCGCITGEFVPLPADEVSLTNNWVNVGIKIMIRQVYYDLRASEWSDVSTLFYQDAKGCFDTAEGLSRCLKLRIPLGNPLVDKTEIAYSSDNGVSWSLYDTIEKYSSYTDDIKYWYDRTLSDAIDGNIDPDDECFFFYYFCNNKQCQPLDPKETSRVFNPIPRQPQGLIPVKNSLGFYNYKKGTCPIDAEQLKKVSVSLNAPDVTDCHPEMVSVKVRAIIHDFELDQNQFIYRAGGKYGDNDDANDMAYFGGVKHTVYPFVQFPDQAFDQLFSAKARNFIVYIEGTDYWGEMKQYYCDMGMVGQHEVGVLAGATDEDSKLGMVNPLYGGGFYFQEYTFKVKKGTTGFIRMCSHHEKTVNDDTSTFLSGMTTDIYTYNSYRDLAFDYDNQNFEIYFDACAGDVDIAEAFVISDGQAQHQDQSVGYHGYIKINGSPVEGLRVSLLGNSGDFFATTDHNGFFFKSFMPTIDLDSNINVSILAEQDCGDFSEIRLESFATFSGQNVRHDVIFSDSDYNDDFFTTVNVNVKDCDNIGIGGIPIALSGSKFKTTSGAGLATFKIRNYITRDREVKAIAMDRGQCFVFDCADNCNPCLSGVSSTTSACYAKSAHAGVSPVVTLTNIVLSRGFSNILKRGLKKGGRYGWAAMLEGGCGKITTPFELGYMDIPKLQENGKVSFAEFNFAIDNTIQLPFDGCLKILRTENLNPFELQWIVDKAERKDGKIIITIQSLNDYNASFNFKTNSVYKYLAGDRVEFIRDGNGMLFDTATFGSLNFKTVSPFYEKILNNSDGDNTVADYFNQIVIIDEGKFNNNLDYLDGALIEIQRENKCSTDPEYFEICKSIPVVNGTPVDFSGTFETFDSYLVSRSLGSVNGTFEHHSPSDLWGDKLSDIGKVHIVNKYENEYRVGRGISLNAPNLFNYFGDLEKVFDAPEQGDIIAMGIKDGSIIMAIGENDSFIAQAANDLVRVGGDGIIRALPADQIISDPQPKVKGEFGCQYPHIGSIFFGDGFATWADVSKGAYVKHDYNIAVDVSKNQVQSFFRRRFRDMEVANASALNDSLKVRFSCGFNKANSEIIITIRPLLGGFVNNEKKPFVLPNDTIRFHPDTNDFTTFASYTAEAYGSYDLLDNNGCAFVSFKNGIPYIHPINSVKFNEFFGQAVDRVAGITINKFPEKVKIPIGIEIQDDTMWYVHSVITDNPDFISEIPPKRVTKENGKWNSSFLANKNSRGGLYGRDNARGYFATVTLIRDNSDNLKYGIFDNSKRIKYDELGMIITKFLLSEQSGMTGNL